MAIRHCSPISDADRSQRACAMAGNFPTDSSDRHAHVDKVKRALLIDTAVPADAKVEEKEQEKISRLGRELKRLWKVETKGHW